MKTADDCEGVVEVGTLDLGEFHAVHLRLLTDITTGTAAGLEEQDRIRMPKTTASENWELM
jgi:hypothetical protein